MCDGPVRRWIKRFAGGLFWIELALRRAVARARGDRPWRLGGACRRAARCCEAPAMRVGRLVWYAPTLRRLFIWWQQAVNGFVLERRERAGRVLVFRCTHFEPSTRSCDSYDSRPAMCRDYPRALLEQATPELFPECGYRAVAAGAERMLAALEAQPLTTEQRERLSRELRLR